MSQYKRLAEDLGYMVSPVSSHGVGQAWDWYPKPTMMANKFRTREEAQSALEAHVRLRLEESRQCVAIAAELGL